MSRADGPDRAANHLALVARWADDLAHEIKNPFHAMVINLELVKRRAGDAEAARERAEIVESELHRVHGLVDSVLSIVRPWPDDRAANLDSVLDPMLPAFRARAALHHVDFRYEPVGGPTGIPVAPGDLALIILNLVDNAIDAAPKDGRIRLRCRREERGVVIQVDDSGPGFPDLAGDAFDAGITGRSGRAGLGLAVARALAESAGGSLVVDASGDPGGTTVALTLPGPGAA